ncbi:MAG: hypothetical protein K2Y37_07535 [Pirellulales bacterium]|nr:hypothetical protein [Pirellulales bacterium]
MDAADFITLSGKLVSMGKSGARSAVSRAYYGAFHVARAVLIDLASESCGSGKAHNLVPLYLGSANHPDASVAANLLSDLHANRIKADYSLDLARAESQPFATHGVETAHEIQRRLILFRAACEQDVELRGRLRDGIARIKAAFGT